MNIKMKFEDYMRRRRNKRNLRIAQRALAIINDTVKTMR